MLCFIFRTIHIALYEGYSANTATGMISLIVLFLAGLLDHPDFIEPWTAPHGEHALVSLRKNKS